MEKKKEMLKKYTFYGSFNFSVNPCYAEPENYSFN